MDRVVVEPKAIVNAGQVAPVTMEEVAYRLTDALSKVVLNKGAPGPDGQTVAQLREQWLTAGPKLAADLLAGRYRPGVIRRANIPKAGGGVRGLGIPTVTSYPKVVQRVFGFVGGHASVSSAQR
jgi:retron-type reverse transcriptase